MESLNRGVNTNVYGQMVQVQLRVPDDMVRFIDFFVHAGRFQSRSEAIKHMIAEYEEREKTRKFYEMLTQRSREAKDHPERLIPLRVAK